VAGPHTDGKRCMRAPPPCWPYHAIARGVRSAAPRTAAARTPSPCRQTTMLACKCSRNSGAVDRPRVPCIATRPCRSATHTTLQCPRARAPPDVPPDDISGLLPRLSCDADLRLPSSQMGPLHLRFHHSTYLKRALALRPLSPPIAARVRHGWGVPVADRGPPSGADRAVDCASGIHAVVSRDHKKSVSRPPWSAYTTEDASSKGRPAAVEALRAAPCRTTTVPCTGRDTRPRGAHCSVRCLDCYQPSQNRPRRPRASSRCLVLVNIQAFERENSAGAQAMTVRCAKSAGPNCALNAHPNEKPMRHSTQIPRGRSSPVQNDDGRGHGFFYPRNPGVLPSHAVFCVKWHPRL